MTSESEKNDEPVPEAEPPRTKPSKMSGRMILAVLLSMPGVAEEFEELLGEDADE